MYSLVFLFTFGFLLAEFTAVIADNDEGERQALRCWNDQYGRDWTFRRDLPNGPDNWGDKYEQCYGFQQSPINIDTNCISDEDSPHWALLLYIIPIFNPIFYNDGHALTMVPGDDLVRSIYINYTQYDFVSAHLHFSCSKCCGNGGSEHTIDGQSYDMELHLIHKQPESNETLVVAVFFKEVCGSTNSELCLFTNAAKKILYKGMYYRSPERVDLLNLVPGIIATHYQYQGSLTTPDCEEGITWIVLETPLVVGCDQMEIFRQMSSAPQWFAQEGCKMCGNTRPVQDLHRRKVYKSWQGY